MQKDGNFATACTAYKAFYKPHNLTVIQRIRNNAVTDKINSDIQLVCQKKKPADKSMVSKFPEQILSFDSQHTKCTVFNYNSMC
jgi:hypothetical protein